MVFDKVWWDAENGVFQVQYTSGRKCWFTPEEVQDSMAKFGAAMETAGMSATSHNSSSDAITLWRDLFASKPSPEGFSDFLHRNAGRIKAVLA